MKVARNLAWMVFGYLVAVFVATLVTVALISVLSAFPDGGRLDSFDTLTRDILAIAYVGLIVTSGYALPGWLISVVIAGVRAETRRVYFISSGVLTALLAHLILWGFSGSSPIFGRTGEMGGIVLWSMIGGLCGGLAYWRVAVVRFGRWRTI
jgi:hypothetical protein